MWEDKGSDLLAEKWSSVILMIQLTKGLHGTGKEVSITCLKIRIQQPPNKIGFCDQRPKMEAFTPEDEQIDLDRQIISNKQIVSCANRANKSSYICPSGKMFFPDNLPIKTNKSTTVQHNFKSDGQMPADLSVQTICSSSKTANK